MKSGKISETVTFKLRLGGQNGGSVGRELRIREQAFWEKWRTHSGNHENRGTVAECPRVATCRYRCGRGGAHWGESDLSTRKQPRRLF